MTRPEQLKKLVRDVPDFPQPGIIFRDITPILADKTVFREVIDLMSKHWVDKDVDHVAAWCPSCFVSGRPAPIVEGLDTYLSLLELAYTAPPVGPGQTVATGAGRRPIAGSGYLGTVVPHSAQLDSILKAAFVEHYQRGTDLLVARRYPDAIGQLREALTWNPDSAEAHNNLGIALASSGRMDDALNEFKQALAIDPEFDDARRNLEMATRRK